jgi:hypothetical protein
MDRGLNMMDIGFDSDPPTDHLYGNRLFDREIKPYPADDILAPCAAVYDHRRSPGSKVQSAYFPLAISVGRRALAISFGAPDWLVAHSHRFKPFPLEAFAGLIAGIVAADWGIAA